MKISLVNPLEVDKKIINEHKAKLEEMGHEFISYDDNAKDDDELIERLKDTDIAIITNKALSAKVIDASKNLELIDVAFTGVDHIDLAAVKENGITLVNASGYSDDSVAELVIGLTIAVMRKFNNNRSNIFEGENNNLMGETIQGKKFGIIGTGNIGIKLIKILKAFDCEILAYSRTQKDEVKDLVHHISK